MDEENSTQEGRAEPSHGGGRSAEQATTTDAVGATPSPAVAEPPRAPDDDERRPRPVTGEPARRPLSASAFACLPPEPATPEDKRRVRDLVDLADEDVSQSDDGAEIRAFETHHDAVHRRFSAHGERRDDAPGAPVAGARPDPRDGPRAGTRPQGTAADVDPVAIVRAHLPPDPLLQTPFGLRRLTYADYTASGRSLHFIEEYLSRVVSPSYANTHTETSATGLQTTHFREEAREIILRAVNADPALYELVFAGTGSTGAIAKLIAILGFRVPEQQSRHLKDIPEYHRPLILVSEAEHHSNELLWRETIADVQVLPPDDSGSLDLAALRRALEENRPKRKLIIGSFSAGSNVTGITTDPAPVAQVMHKYKAYCCFDFAGAGPYVDMCMMPREPGADPQGYLDAIFVSPHKFLGGPGTPGLLVVRKEFANCTNASDYPPTVAGGGTVRIVTTNCRHYEPTLHVREEAGTPGIMESIRCGLVFRVREMVTPERIEQIEGRFAQRIVERLQAKGVWVMGDRFSQIRSPKRLSITSFNVWCRPDGEPLRHPMTQRPLLLHPHFVSALLNDLYGISARSGCSCAGPLAFRLFGYDDDETMQTLVDLAHEDYHAPKPGWARINIQYTTTEPEFDFLCSAVEQVAEHGWKLLPLYALCLRTGQFLYNGRGFNRFRAVRRLSELTFTGQGVTWNEAAMSTDDRAQYLRDAREIFDDAPELVRKMLYRFRDMRRKDVPFPPELERLRWFVLGSEILGHLGISKQELDAARLTDEAQDALLNPRVAQEPESSIEWATFGRSRG